MPWNVRPEQSVGIWAIFVIRDAFKDRKFQIRICLGSKYVKMEDEGLFLIILTGMTVYTPLKTYVCMALIITVQLFPINSGYRVVVASEVRRHSLRTRVKASRVGVRYSLAFFASWLSFVFVNNSEAHPLNFLPVGVAFIIRRISLTSIVGIEHVNFCPVAILIIILEVKLKVCLSILGY